MKKIFILSLLSSVTLAQAYVLPPSYFFQEWVSDKKPSSGILIKQERDYLADGTVVQKTIPETVKIKKPGLYKWVSEIPGQEEVKILGRYRASTGNLQQQSTTTLQNIITPVEVAVIYSQAGTIDSFMKQMNVDTSKTKLELVQKMKLLRVGDEKGNRVYISPDTGTMDAMIYQGKLYLLKYDTAKFGFYPSEIQVFENNILKEKVRVRSMNSNAKISDSEFESR